MWRRARPWSWRRPGRRSRPRGCSWSRCRCSCGSDCRCWAGGRGRGRSAVPARTLNFNLHWRASLKERYCRVGGLRRLVGIESEVIQCAVANRIGVLICGKSFRAPCDRAYVLDNTPWCAAVPGIAYRPIVREARMLRRRMKSDVANVNARS
jgi:hypothetical protein